MNNIKKTNKKWLGASILAAISTSLCCITPILAIFAGVGGIASAFSWLEPLRPYLIALTIIFLAVAWYKTLKPKSSEIDCDCEAEKGRFINSKAFLLLITIITVTLLAFPYYSHIFVPKQDTKEIIIVNEKNLVKMQFTINDMTCSACEGQINHKIAALEGVLNVETSYKHKESIVLFDTTKTKIEDIIKAVDETGYNVSSHKKIKEEFNKDLQ